MKRQNKGEHRTSCLKELATGSKKQIMIMDLAGEIKEVHRPNEGKEKTNASLENRADDLEHYTCVNVITFSGLETRPQYDSDSDGRWVAHQARNRSP